MSIRKIVATVVFVASLCGASAQPESSQRARYEAFKAAAMSQYKSFRDEANAKYANLLRSKWGDATSNESVALKRIPEPPQPVVTQPVAQPTSDIIEVKEIVAPPIVMADEPEAEPLVEVATRRNRSGRTIESAIPRSGGLRFSFYGTPCVMNVDNSYVFNLDGVTEDSVADAWEFLSGEKYTPVVSAAIEWRDNLKLNDWGYLRFLESFTTELMGQQRRNEAVVMQMFMLIQSGYKVRIARCGEDLTLLLPFNEQICEYRFLRLDDECYYIRNRSLNGGGYAVFNQKFPNEKLLSIRWVGEPKLAQSTTKSRTIAAKRYRETVADVATNKNLIDFYGDYPRSNRWNNYSHASLSSGVKRMLYPVLQRSIEGKDPVEAANILLDMVQSGLDYKTDDEQFGVERPLFADESLYYPYCDCEDRSILYSILVRDLLGLDVVLLNYPLHLATAVAFDGRPEGDYISLKGRRFVICDPTYIGANVGQSMPQFKGVKATVVEL